MRIVAYIVLTLCLIGCNDSIRPPKKPANLIPKDTFVDLLTEMSLIETNYQLKYVQISRYAKAIKADCDSFLIAKGYSPELYNQSMTYYGELKNEMVEIYEEVNARLVARKKELDQEIQANRPEEEPED